MHVFYTLKTQNANDLFLDYGANACLASQLVGSHNPSHQEVPREGSGKTQSETVTKEC